MMLCMQMGDHGVSGQHKYQLEEAQRAEKRVSFPFTWDAAVCSLLSNAHQQRVVVDDLS